MSMSKQNRVQPDGQIVAVAARGTFMGNRGILHNVHGQVLRPYTHKAWIICLLNFKGRKRQVMRPNNYTELFFLDEATALAAGHRPCYECRREQAQAFRTAWVVANPTLADGPQTRMGQIDAVLHQERLTEAFYVKDKRKRVFTAVADTLPNGTFIQLDKTFYLIWDDAIYPWSPEGYSAGRQRPLPQTVTVLTPPSTVDTLANGYTPIIHDSAQVIIPPLSQGKI